MKGATPDGPRITITSIASAKTTPRGTGFSRESPDCSHKPKPRGQTCNASIPAIVKTTSGVDDSLGVHHPVMSRRSRDNAVSIESARKKTHPTQTSANVAARWRRTSSHRSFVSS